MRGTMQRRSEYKSMIHFDKTINKKPADGQRTIDEPSLVVELLNRYKKLDDSYRHWSLEDGIRWMMGFANYVNEKNSHFKCRYEKHKFNKGDIILVDLFGHFGSELTYDHPAIVLNDEFNGCIIAPISSTAFNDSVKTHVDLPKQISDMGNLKNNCAIKLEQIRYVSKKRILKKFNRVSNNDKLKEIDDLLMQHLAGFTYTKLVQRNEQFQQNWQNTMREKAIVETELEQLKVQYSLLEQNYQSLLQQKNSNENE